MGSTEQRGLKAEAEKQGHLHPLTQSMSMRLDGGCRLGNALTHALFSQQTRPTVDLPSTEMGHAFQVRRE